MRKNLKNAGFKLVTSSDSFELWVTPKTGRVCYIGRYDAVASAIATNGGITVDKDAPIEAVIHQLNSDEHYLIDKML